MNAENPSFFSLKSFPLFHFQGLKTCTSFI
nr:MAG TPA: hypothetical protein [Caudoviricetes sp.]